MAKKLDLEKVHNDFFERYMISQRKVISEELRQAKAGRKPIPESEHRENNKVSVYLNEEEMKTVREFVGDRKISDVMRDIVLGEARRTKGNG